ncbi:MAG: carbamoyltransferase [Gammaproteobacteria bacterium]|nr:carbamoyltransferase [Gammaproteobacteria bacterium]
MYILGINAYHGDSSACLVKDGVLIAAAEEERFRRLKHWAGFPSESIKYCLTEAGINLNEVTHVAINQDSKANLWKKIGFTLAKRPDVGMLMDRIRNKQERANVRDELSQSVDMGLFSGKVHEVEHHLAHLSSAFHVSPFDKAVVVSIDGFGDFASTAWGFGNGKNIAIDDKVYFPNSLGIFYQAMTQWLGFPHYGDEYKVMGLAPYGQPNYMDEMRQLVTLQEDGGFKLTLKYFRHHKEKVEYEWENGEPKVGRLFSDALVDLLGPVRQKDEALSQWHMDIARSIQAMYEEAFFHLLNVLHKRHGSDYLALAGGCAMNSVANGKVYRQTPFKNIYIQSAAGDAGGAIGAAFSVWHKLGGARDFVMDHAYWGPGFSGLDFRKLLEVNSDRLEEKGCVVTHITDEVALCERTAIAIAEGNVIGWFQGRMEWGPRALGNRSILGDPRRADMKDILNLKIKRRESFRPFAPSILREAVAEWFEQDDDVPFMMQVYPIRESKREMIPAVTHVDGSGRLQTVSQESNGRYYRLIKAFGNKTGVPIVLNTSFNENEPVVCRPEEALDCFLRTKMDVLVLGDWFIQRVS